jgi:Mg2+-importing ATPase
LKILCGEQVWIITGDAPAVATKVACDLGILPYKSTSVQHVAIKMDSPVDEKALIITGAQLAALSTNQAAFDKAINRCIILAKVSPHQKLQIVEVLRKSGGGQAVAFLGDGVNDSLAIRAADIGISVDSGTEIAKEAADVILLEKSLDVIAHGVLQGRMTCVLIFFISLSDSD